MLRGPGFDTATEVALLVIAGSAGAAGLPWYAILCLPILFAAGMSLLDAIDGSFMNFAYDWAFSKPVRKVFYNLTITGLSVAVALMIGTIELGGLLAQHLNLSGSFWSWFENIDINLLGFVIAGMFLATWAIALSIWHLGRIEQRWNNHMDDGPIEIRGLVRCTGARHPTPSKTSTRHDHRHTEGRDHHRRLTGHWRWPSGRLPPAGLQRRCHLSLDHTL